MQRGLAIRCAQARIGPACNQALQCLEIGLLGGDVKRRLAIVVARRKMRARRDQAIQRNIVIALDRLEYGLPGQRVRRGRELGDGRHRKQDGGKRDHALHCRHAHHLA